MLAFNRSTAMRLEAVHQLILLFLTEVIMVLLMEAISLARQQFKFLLT